MSEGILLILRYYLKNLESIGQKRKQENEKPTQQNERQRERERENGTDFYFIDTKKAQH